MHILILAQSLCCEDKVYFSISACSMSVDFCVRALKMSQSLWA